MQRLKVTLRRFIKGFVAAGLAQVAILINAGITIHNLADARNLLTVLGTAFIAGGLLGLEKLVNYEQAPHAPQ